MSDEGEPSRAFDAATLGRAGLFGLLWALTGLISAALLGPLAEGPSLWLPSGLALGAFHAFPNHRRILAVAVALAALGVEAVRGFPLAVALGLTVAHVVEPALGAFGLRDLIGARFRPHSHLGRVLVVAVPACAASAVLISLCGGGDIGRVWAAHYVGTVFVAPVVDAWRSHAQGPRLPSGARVAEAVLLLALLIGLVWLVFGAPPGSGSYGLFPFVLLPPLVWAAARFGMAVTSGATLLVVLEAVRHTLQGLGPFAADGAGGVAGELPVRLFLAAVCLPALFLAQVIEDHKRAIRELRRTEQTLEREQELFRRAEAAARVGSWRLDLETGDILLSDEALRLTGLPEEHRSSPVAEGIAEIVHPADREGLLAALRQAGRESLLRTPPFRVIHANGDVRVLSAEGGDIVRDRRGRPVVRFGIVRDMTEQHQLERSLRDSEEHRRGLFEGARTVMLVIEPESGRILDANPAACDFYQYSLSELCKRRIGDLEDVPLSPPEDGAAFPAGSLARGRVELRQRLASGVRRDVVVYSSPVRLGSGTSLFSVVHDITELRRAEEQAREGLREVGETLRSVLDATPLAVLMLDGEGRVSLLNPAAQRILGWEGGSLEGRRLAEVLGEDGTRADAIAARALRGDSMRGCEIERYRGDGTPVVLRAFTAPLRRSDGGAQGAVVVFEDATESRLVNEALQLAQKLEVLATLAGGVAHDFNNLLTVIVGHVNLALRKLPAQGAARAHLEKMLPALEQATALGKKMLTYSGGARPVVGLLDVAGTIRDDRAILEAAVPTHVRLEFVVPDSLPPIEGAPEEIRQTLTALLANAVEAIGARRGVVRIMATTRLVSGGDATRFRYTGQRLRPGRYVALEVSDDGCGIAAETLPRIFDPFFTTKFVGRGLGLAAVLGIVRSHHGGIAVESAPGLGSRFEIVFPLSGAPAGDADVEVPAAETGLPA